MSRACAASGTQAPRQTATTLVGVQMSRKRKKRQREERSAERTELGQREIQALHYAEIVLNEACALLHDFGRGAEGLPYDGVTRSLSPAERAKRAYEAGYQCSEWISGLLMLRWCKTGVDGMGSVISPEDMLDTFSALQDLCDRYATLDCPSHGPKAREE